MAAPERRLPRARNAASIFLRFVHCRLPAFGSLGFKLARFTGAAAGAVAVLYAIQELLAGHDLAH